MRQTFACFQAFPLSSPRAFGIFIYTPRRGAIWGLHIASAV